MEDIKPLKDFSY